MIIILQAGEFILLCVSLSANDEIGLHYMANPEKKVAKYTIFWGDYRIRTPGCMLKKTLVYHQTTLIIG